MCYISFCFEYAERLLYCWSKSYIIMSENNFWEFVFSICYMSQGINIKSLGVLSRIKYFSWVILRLGFFLLSILLQMACYLTEIWDFLRKCVFKPPNINRIEYESLSLNSMKLLWLSGCSTFQWTTEFDIFGPFLAGTPKSRT